MRTTTAVVAIALWVASNGAAQPAQTHWEPYKNSAARPSVDQKLLDPVLDGAIDLHAHYGPDAYPRQWDAFEVAALGKERGLRAVVLKNHWTETAGLAYLVRKYGAQGIEVFGAVTLDTPTGHVAPEETLLILAQAKERGITRAIVTHPLLDPQFTFMTIAQLRDAVAFGGVIEITAGSLFRDGPGRARVLEAIRALGPESFFVASDSGLVGTPNHTDALVMAARVLRANGYDERALDAMFKANPARLLGLEER